MKKLRIATVLTIATQQGIPDDPKTIAPFVYAGLHTEQAEAIDAMESQCKRLHPNCRILWETVAIKTIEDAIVKEACRELE